MYDLVPLGRANLDLFSQDVGTGFEDITSIYVDRGHTLTEKPVAHPAPTPPTSSWVIWGMDHDR